MKTSMKLILAASLLGSVSLVGAGSAMAQPRSYSFRVTEVQRAYTDGYYDQNRNWHAWRNARERAWLRSNYKHYKIAYKPMRHDRDHDGVPDALDRAPNNPTRN